MANRLKNFFQEFPMTLVFAIGGAILCYRLFDNLLWLLGGVIIGVIIGATIDESRKSKK